MKPKVFVDVVSRLDDFEAQALKEFRASKKGDDETALIMLQDALKAVEQKVFTQLSQELARSMVPKTENEEQ